MFAQSGHRLIKALYIRQVFPCGPANRAPIESSTELTVNVVVEHLPAVAEWPRNSNQKRHRHVCSDCGAVFKEKLQLIEHVKSEHGRNRFSCTCCECTFVSKGAWTQGTYPVHSSESRQISMRNVWEGLRESHKLGGSSHNSHRRQAKCMLSLPGIICI